MYVFEKARVSCYKSCEKNKSIKLQKITLSRLLVQRYNEFKYRQQMTQNELTVLHNTALSEIVSLAKDKGITNHGPWSIDPLSWNGAMKNEIN